MFTAPYAGMTRTGSTVDDPAGRPLSPRSEADSRVDEYEIVPGERTPALLPGNATQRIGAGNSSPSPLPAKTSCATQTTNSPAQNSTPSTGSPQTFRRSCARYSPRSTARSVGTPRQKPVASKPLLPRSDRPRDASPRNPGSPTTTTPSSPPAHGTQRRHSKPHSRTAENKASTFNSTRENDNHAAQSHFTPQHGATPPHCPGRTWQEHDDQARSRTTSRPISRSYVKL